MCRIIHAYFATQECPWVQIKFNFDRQTVAGGRPRRGEYSPLTADYEDVEAEAGIAAEERV